MPRNSFIYLHTLRSVGAVPTDVNDVESAQREGVLVMPFFIQDSLCLNIGHSSTSNDGIEKMATSQSSLQCEKTCEKAFSPTKGLVALSMGLPLLCLSWDQIAALTTTVDVSSLRCCGNAEVV